MESLIVSRMRSHGIPGKSLADVHFDVTVHIRHGDKAAEMRLVPAVRYIEVCRGIRRFLGRNISVFLLTDDPDALSEFQTRSDFDLFWLHYDFRGDNVHAKWVEHGDQAGLIGVEGVVLGARSDFYVGTFASNYDRIILHTKAVRYGGSSGWYFEVGERKCVTVAHCALLREEFDWQEVWLR
jgi:hypothetical protein